MQKSSSKHTQAGSSCEELVARTPTVKAGLNSDIQFKNYVIFRIKCIHTRSHQLKLHVHE